MGKSLSLQVLFHKIGINYWKSLIQISIYRHKGHEKARMSDKYKENNKLFRNNPKYKKIHKMTEINDL
jgi:hypothetical protein